MQVEDQIDQKKNGFVKGRIKSVAIAVKGMWMLITTEHSIMIQLTISVLVCILGWLLNISVYEWIAQLSAIGLVLVAESLNTAIEKLCDFIHPEFNPKIGFIKDVSAGAVAFAALIALLIGLIIYFPRLSEFF